MNSFCLGRKIVFFDRPYGHIDALGIKVLLNLMLKIEIRKQTALSGKNYKFSS